MGFAKVEAASPDGEPALLVVPVETRRVRILSSAAVRESDSVNYGGSEHTGVGRGDETNFWWHRTRTTAALVCGGFHDSAKLRRR